METQTAAAAKNMEYVRRKECGKHDRAPNEEDILRICMTCDTHHYACDLCRSARNIPENQCCRCAPALKILRGYLDRIDYEMTDLNQKLKKHEFDAVKFEEGRKQINQLRKQNEEYKTQLQTVETELEKVKQSQQSTARNYDHLTDSIQPKKELTQALKGMLEKQAFTDCVLINHSHRYPAHKCILMLRSEALRRLIEQATTARTEAFAESPEHQHTSSRGKGKNKNNYEPPPESTLPSQYQMYLPITIEVNEIDSDIMPFVLNFIYTAETENKINDRNVKEIMKAADWLEMTDLRKSCLLFMEKRISKQTVIPILIEAYELNNDRLKTKCMNYIQAQNIDLVKSSQWVKFKEENPKLALELYERYVQETGASASQKPKNPYPNAHTHSHAKTDTKEAKSSSDTPTAPIKKKQIKIPPPPIIKKSSQIPKTPAATKSPASVTDHQNHHSYNGAHSYQKFPPLSHYPPQPSSQYPATNQPTTHYPPQHIQFQPQPMVHFSQSQPNSYR